MTLLEFKLAFPAGQAETVPLLDRITLFLNAVMAYITFSDGSIVIGSVHTGR